MLIHYYCSKQYDYLHPYVCSFYTPYDPKYSQIVTWLAQTFRRKDFVDEVHHGEVRFRCQQHAELFLLRWL